MVFCGKKKEIELDLFSDFPLTMFTSLRRRVFRGAWTLIGEVLVSPYWLAWYCVWFDTCLTVYVCMYVIMCGMVLLTS